MDPKRGKKSSTSRQGRSQPVHPQPQQTPFPNQFYVPHPASPHQYYQYNMAPPQMNPQHYNIANTCEFTPFLDAEDDGEDDEFVAETQQPPIDEDEDVEEVDAREKKKAFGGRKPREHWSPEQEGALAKAWIQISECKKFGNEQKADGFWKRVLEHYRTNLGSTSRTFHSLNTKWKTMNTAMGVFNGYYLQAKRAKASGCNDLDVVRIALADYYTKTKKQFGHMLAWEVVRGHDKWVEQDCFQESRGAPSNSSKRKSGEYESASNTIPDMNENPIPPLESRKTKKKQGASSSSVSSIANEITSYTQRKTLYLEEKREKDELAKALLATQLEGAKFKNTQREMKFFMEPHDHIRDPTMLEFVLAQKREVAAKNGWPCNF